MSAFICRNVTRLSNVFIINRCNKNYGTTFTLGSLTSCLSNAPARAWTSASNNAVPRMTLLREEREAWTICTNRMALYLSRSTNDVTGDSSPVSVGAEIFIWISWDPWVIITRVQATMRQIVFCTAKLRPYIRAIWFPPWNTLNYSTQKHPSNFEGNTLNV